MKRTDEDRDFAKRFSAALQPHVDNEREQGKSLAKIAARLGISATGLQKQLSGVMPSVRTVALAYANYGVSVLYGTVEVKRALSGKRKGKGSSFLENQLSLPFEITAPPNSKHLVLRLVPRSTRRYQLQLTVGMSA
jgi:transcriptional regulator with XRE-family HTH domain